jgi:hypothetical protein
MRLFLADIHLTRCRLFGTAGRRSQEPGDRSQESGVRIQESGAGRYPWESPEADLAAAEKIIQRETKFTRPDGTTITARYARRDDELADAKRALLGA